MFLFISNGTSKTKLAILIQFLYCGEFMKTSTVTFLILTKKFVKGKKVDIEALENMGSMTSVYKSFLLVASDCCRNCCNLCFSKGMLSSGCCLVI